jgi:hypothetical protein
MGRGRVNEDGFDGLRREKSREFMLSQTFAQTVVKKGSPAAAASESFY